jgi:hypothetical protein
MLRTGGACSDNQEYRQCRGPRSAERAHDGLRTRYTSAVRLVERAVCQLWAVSAFARIKEPFQPKSLQWGRLLADAAQPV